MVVVCPDPEHGTLPQLAAAVASPRNAEEIGDEVGTVGEDGTGERVLGIVSVGAERFVEQIPSRLRGTHGAEIPDVVIAAPAPADVDAEAHALAVASPDSDTHRSGETEVGLAVA